MISPATGWNIIPNTTDPTPDISLDENIPPGAVAIDYIIQLQTNSDSGCVDISQDTITVYPTPWIDFIMSNNTGCDSLNVIFNNISDPQNGENITSMSFEWQIDSMGIIIDAFTTTNLTEEFYAIPEDTICYTVELKGTTQHQCESQKDTSICIYPDPIAEIDTSFAGCFCAPLQIDTLGITYKPLTANFSIFNEDLFLFIKFESLVPIVSLYASNPVKGK